MTTNEEAWEAVKEKTAQLRTGARQRRPSAVVDVQEDNVMEAVRAGFLQAHVGACRQTSGNGYDGPWSYCGADFQTGRRGKRINLDKPWYCDDGREIEELR